jgi:hypothetical protein
MAAVLDNDLASGAGYIFGDDATEEDDARMQKAVEELRDELQRRGRLTEG